MFQLYYGVSWVSYQYDWSIYPDTKQSVVMLTPQPWAQSRAAITTIFKGFGMTQPRIEPATSRTLYHYTTKVVMFSKYFAAN